MIKYNYSIVTFFDILGFRNIVKDHEDPCEIINILEILQKYSKPDKEISKLYEIDFTNFSDSIVRSVNIFSNANIKSRIGILFWEILNLTHIQIELINKGVIVRGGLTINAIYHKNPIVFGPALIRSYELESQIAVFPVILIDEDIVSLVEEPILRYGIHDYKKEKDYILNLLREYNDKFYFIDYLRIAIEELDDIEEYPIFLLEHKELIMKNNCKFKNNPDIFKKYLWMAEYHNDVVEYNRSVLIQLCDDVDTLIIDIKKFSQENLLYVGNDLWRNKSNKNEFD